MNGAYPPQSRSQTMPQPSAGEYDWSGMKNYDAQNLTRADSPYSPTIPFNRGDLVTLPDSGAYNGYPQSRPSAGFGPGPPPVGMHNGRRPSESRPIEDGSRNSSPAVSIANSRSSDGTISDQQSRKYRRMETELAQHYNILRAYLRGGAQQPPRPNKARDKLLRLTPVQFHELSTDVFDELQRRQSADSPLPTRPLKRNVPPFLQPRPDFHEKRNQARQKLSSLQLSRFRDLSTDVFCELERRFPHFTGIDINRRQSPGSGRPPPSRAGPNSFVPPPRTHSSSASIGSNGQRIPRKGSFSDPPPQYDNPPAEGEVGRPMPKQFQSNTVMPNKSTMVEDDDEASGVDNKHDRSSDAFGLESAITDPHSKRDTAATSRSETNSNRDVKLLEVAQAQVAELQDKIDELEITLKTKNADIKRLEEESRSGNIADLEKKLADVESSNQALRIEIEHLQTDQASTERDLRSKLDAAKKKQSGDTTLRTKFESLEREHQNLQEQLAQQQRVTEEVRQEATGFLNEMRAMAEGGSGNLEREERLQEIVHRLEEEVKVWKSRYARAKTQLRTMRASSVGLSFARPDASTYTKDTALQNENGLIKDVHVTKFQISIDELLRIARANEPAAILDYMKLVVIAVRRITGDIDTAPVLIKNDEMSKRRAKLKSKVCVTANNLITASKNHAAASGLSPVSLLDAAASHLTVAVVDLVRTVKIRPTPAGELEDDDKETLEPLQNGYFDVDYNTRKTSPHDSVYSALSTTPTDPNLQSGPGPSVQSRSVSGNVNGQDKDLGIKPGFGLREDDNELEELKFYLDKQTDNLVLSIQSLVSSIRAEDVMPIVRSHISDIVEAVGNAVSATEGSAEELPSYSMSLKKEAFPITSSLTEYKTRLLTLSIESQTFDSGSKPGAKDFVQKLPPLAFEIAREMKKLVQQIEVIESGGEDEDLDFS